MLRLVESDVDAPVPRGGPTETKVLGTWGDSKDRSRPESAYGTARTLPKTQTKLMVRQGG
jgi:hypothetical protein